jgi:hypothetical protein
VIKICNIHCTHYVIATIAPGFLIYFNYLISSAYVFFAFGVHLCFASFTGALKFFQKSSGGINNNDHLNIISV